IRAMTGEAGFELVEEVRGLVREMHGGDEEAAAQLDELLRSLDDQQILLIAKSFTVFLEVSNVAEDRQRIRVLRARARESYPEPPPETIRAAIAKFHQEGRSSSEVQSVVERARIELVLTAHPTEAK